MEHEVDKSDDEQKNTLFSSSIYNDQPLPNEHEEGKTASPEMTNSDYLSLPTKAHKRTTEESKKFEGDLINVKKMLEENILDIYEKKASDKSPFLNGHVIQETS